MSKATDHMREVLARLNAARRNPNHPLGRLVRICSRGEPIQELGNRPSRTDIRQEVSSRNFRGNGE